MDCRLCRGECVEFARDRHRAYVRCVQCGVILVPREYFLAPEAEKARYALHSNSEHDRAYRDYLAGVVQEIRRVPIDQPSVLDFGSGPGRVLEKLLREQGIACVSYDPLYSLGAEHVSSRYSIVVACEVLEHVRDLQAEIALLGRVLEPGGYLLVRTRMAPPQARFGSWWYARDPTHVNFLAERTMETICRLLDRRMVATDRKDTYLFGPRQD